MHPSMYTSLSLYVELKCYIYIYIYNSIVYFIRKSKTTAQGCVKPMSKQTDKFSMRTAKLYAYFK